MKKIITFCSLLLALCAGATNITNYPLTNNWSSAEWFLLSGVAAQTNWNIPGNYVVSSYVLNSTSNSLWQQVTNLAVTNIYFTNLYTSNLFATNIYTTNLYATNIYVTNIYATTNISDLSFITNLYSSTAYITNLIANNAYISNLFATNIVAQFLYASNAFFTNLWASNAYFANLYATNAYFTNLWASNAYFINLYSSNAFFTNLWSSNAYINNGWITNLYTDKGYITNIFTQQVKYYTNTGTMAPDFAHGYDAITTNASFTFLNPINTDASGKFAETTVKLVENSSGSAIVATPFANCIVISNSYMGVGANGATWFTFVRYGTQKTNVYSNAETH